MVDTKLENLDKWEKQALRWYTAKFGKAGKKEMEHELEHIRDTDELVRAHLHAKMEEELYKRNEAKLKRIFTPEEWERREHLHAQEEEKRRQRRYGDRSGSKGRD